MSVYQKYDELHRFIASGDGDFEDPALTLFAYQFANLAPYRRLCESRGATPGTISSWHDVPPIPASAFKRYTLSSAPKERCQPEYGGRIFESSGTTGAQTSRHFMNAGALVTYQLSLRAGFERFVAPAESGWPILALAPPPDFAPNSSLSYMMDALIRERGGQFLWPEEGEGNAWTTRLADAIRRLDCPAIVFGTAFALVHQLDSGVGESALPAGSLVIETGGFKGRSREVSRHELYSVLAERFCVPETDILAEYGMSEMASQFYDRRPIETDAAGNRIKTAPPWLRTRVLDPVSGGECSIGTPGLLAHYDLANVNSVFAIQTEDWGYAADNGGIVLLGRAPGAILRGCSLLAEESLSS